MSRLIKAYTLSCSVVKITIYRCFAIRNYSWNSRTAWHLVKAGLRTPHRSQNPRRTATGLPPRRNGAQLTCGQGEHGRSVQDDEEQAEIRDKLHVPLGSVSLRVPRVVVVSPLFCFLFEGRSWRGITRRGKKEKQPRFRLEPAARRDRESGSRVPEVTASTRPRERVASSLHFFSFLNASCSIIIHKFILFKPLLCLYPAPPPFRPFTYFFHRPLPSSDGNHSRDLDLAHSSVWSSRCTGVIFPFVIICHVL